MIFSFLIPGDDATATINSALLAIDPTAIDTPVAVALADLPIETIETASAAECVPV